MQNICALTFIKLFCKNVIRTFYRLKVVLFFLIVLAFIVSLRSRHSYQSVDKLFVEVTANPEEAEFVLKCKHRPIWKISSLNSSSPSCQIPRLDAFNPCVHSYVNQPFKNVVCRKSKSEFSFYLDFMSGEPHRIIQDGGPSSALCCYKVFWFKYWYDYERKEEKLCHELSPTRITLIPPNVYYIHLICYKSRYTTEQVYEEYFHIVRRNPDTKVQRSMDGSRSPSVLIIGLGSQSRLNFVRQMPQTHGFLTKDLGAIDLAGLTSVGDDPLSNVLAYMMGLRVSELRKYCWNSTSTFFDDCPFVWKWFYERDYITSFSEDVNGIFNSRFNGFNYQPTEEYLHPFQRYLNLDHSYVSADKMCFGSKLRLEILMSNIQQTAWAYRTVPYFQFVWSSSLNAGGFNAPLAADDSLEETLVFLSSNDLLENTVLLLISDHGFQTGDFMYEFQGRVESRMPFTYIVLPPNFKDKYHSAVNTMIGNQNRLTTPYDVFETLVDISDLSLFPSESTLGSRTSSSMNISTPRGLSLFLPIPLDRTCAKAGIDEQWCVCHLYAMLTETESCAVVDQLAQVVVRTMNTWLRDFPRCAQLRLSHVIQTEVLLNSFDPDPEFEHENYINTGIPCAEIMISPTFQTFRIILSVSPSDADFEAVVHRDPATGSFVMSTEIARIDGMQEEDEACIAGCNIKKICYYTLSLQPFIAETYWYLFIFIFCVLFICFRRSFFRKARRLKVYHK